MPAQIKKKRSARRRAGPYRPGDRRKRLRRDARRRFFFRVWKNRRKKEGKRGGISGGTAHFLWIFSGAGYRHMIQ